jgi:hypothetical protein
MVVAYRIAVTEYNQLMEGKVGALMKEKVELNDEELEILGKRDHERYPPFVVVCCCCCCFL